MESMKQFRLDVVRYTLALACVVAVVAWPFNLVVAKGILMGGLAGVIGFWITARNVHVLASPGADKVQSYAFKWTLVRLFFYALAVYKSYTLDREHYYGLIAAVLGIFMVQIVMITYAFTRLGATGRDD